VTPKVRLISWRKSSGGIGLSISRKRGVEISVRCCGWLGMRDTS